MGNPTTRARLFNHPTLGEIPIVDAREDYWIDTTPRDIKTAVALDPAKCILAKACARQSGHAAFILRRWAFVPSKNKRGKWELWRFAIPASAFGMIKKLDAGKSKEAIKAKGVALTVPSKSERIGVQRKAWHERMARIKAGKHVVKHRAKKARKTHPVALRRGTGYLNKFLVTA